MRKFSDSDFLFQDIFIQWRLTRTPELDRYWADFIAENPLCRDALDTAISKFNTVRINRRELAPEKSEELLRRIANTLARDRRRRKLARMSAAAACAVLLALSALMVYVFAPGQDTGRNSIIAQPLPPEEIKLIAGDKVISMKSDVDINISKTGVVSISDVYSQTVEEVKTTDAVMHKLIVPRGKRSTLTLPDGSKVWLNAGTELQFPSKFTGNERSITVDGEIFVDVAKDAARPFRVHTSDMTVQVYGTSFNVSSYTAGTEKSVVLVSGKVEISYRQGAPQALRPGQMFTLSNGVGEVTAVETERYTSWVGGTLKLDKTPIAELLEKISIYYNVDFKNTDPSLTECTCTGTLILSEHLEDVIQTICLISGTGFELSGDTVYIKNE